MSAIRVKQRWGLMGFSASLPCDWHIATKAYSVAWSQIHTFACHGQFQNTKVANFTNQWLLWFSLSFATSLNCHSLNKYKYFQLDYDGYVVFSFSELVCSCLHCCLQSCFTRFYSFLDLARFEMGSHYRIVLNRHCFTSHQGSTVV